MGCRGEIAKAPQLGRKGLTMVEAAVAVVKVKAEHRERVSVSARAVRKAPANRTSAQCGVPTRPVHNKGTKPLGYTRCAHDPSGLSLTIAGLPLYKTFEKNKKIEFEFPGESLRELIDAV